MLCIGTRIKQGSMITDHGETITWDKCRISLVEEKCPDTYGKSAEVLNIKHEDFKRITGLDYADHMKLVDHELQASYALSENKPVLVSLRIVDTPSDKENKK